MFSVRYAVSYHGGVLNESCISISYYLTPNGQAKRALDMYIIIIVVAVVIVVIIITNIMVLIVVYVAP